jgi:hypothetical protein
MPEDKKHRKRPNPMAGVPSAKADILDFGRRIHRVLGGKKFRNEKRIVQWLQAHPKRSLDEAALAYPKLAQKYNYKPKIKKMRP